MASGLWQIVWRKNWKRMFAASDSSVSRRLALEWLEERAVPTVFSVTNVNDSGAGSFRQAILDSNDTTGPNSIQFNIGNGQETISLQSVLPTITIPVDIDATTQPGYSGTPLILLDGASASVGSSQGAIVLAAGNSTIRGLAIGDWGAPAIYVTGASADTIQSNYLGTFDGLNTALNAGSGIILVNSSSITIGGPTAGQGNVISGNDTGINLTGATTTDNIIQGNMIGTTAAGDAVIGNAPSGVDGIQFNNGASNNLIGGTTAAERNVISGNTNFGVNLDGSDITGNVIEGNYIGVNAAGTAAIGNQDTGVIVQYGASSNTIGGDVAGAGNVISGNGFVGDHSGVDLEGASSNVVAGNYLGTNAAGTAAIANGDDGIAVFYSAGDNTIGGPTAAAANVISGNTNNGVELFGTNSGNVIEGNLIGVNATGTAALANANNGVYLETGETNDVIGGTTAGARNVISGNSTDGVNLDGIGTTGILVEGNYIGLNEAGTAAIGNGQTGVAIGGGATSDTIGGDGAGNVISGNGFSGGHSGIDIDGTGTDDNVVQGNYIGTNAAGTAAIANGTDGIAIFSSAGDNTIGGTTALAANVISGNTSQGIGLFFSADANVMEGNLIGLNAAGTGALGNGIAGIDIGGSNFSDTSSNNLVGGTVAGSSNTIAFNAQGIVVIGTGAVDNSLLGNSIYANTSIGIDLNDDGPTANTPGGLGENANEPNNLQNYPQSPYAFIDSNGNLLVNYFVDSTPNSESSNGTAYPLRVEFFLADAQGQGQTYIGADTFESTDFDNGGKVVNFGSAAALGVASGDQLVMTATDADGNTSEFSPALTVADTIEVTNTNDSGLGSLRQAITDADADTSGTNTISFTMTGAQTITLASDLPAIWEPVVLDGTTEGGYAGTPLIEINDPAGSSAALSLWANDSTIRGLAVDGGPSGVSGILIQGSNDTIAGNYIGLALDGVTAQGNDSYGIYLLGGPSDDVIGGTSTADRNVIANNADGGIYLSGEYESSPYAITIQGNYIGTNAAGTAAAGNGVAGIDIANYAPDTEIVNNVISGNQTGIYQSNTNNTLIEGNIIGLDATGTYAIPNTQSGIWIDGFCVGDIIGSPTAGTGNVISGNDSFGIVIDNNTYDETIQGNYIGLNAAGNATIGNDSYGILVTGGSSDILIGGTDSGDGNVITGNPKGVVVTGTTTVGVTIEENSIYGNGSIGIDLGDDGPTPDTAGGAAVGSGPNNLENFPLTTYARIDANGDLLVDYFVNTTSFDFGEGGTNYPLRVEFFKADATGEGQTYLGADNYTTTDLDNGGKVVDLGNAAALGIEEGDQIVLTATDGLSDTSEFSDPATPVVNTIQVTNTNDSGPGSLRQAILDANSDPGTDTITFALQGEAVITPLTPLPAITDAVVLDGTTEGGYTGSPLIELVGPGASSGETGLEVTDGNSTIRGLVINGFGTGILLSGGGNNVIENDYLGTDLAGTNAAPNGVGVLLSNSADNNIGSYQYYASTIISGNLTDGISLQGAGTTDNIIEADFIGIGADGSTALGNGQAGVDLASDSGDELLEYNQIANNGGAGVQVSSQENSILSNTIFGNDSPGILLQNGGNGGQSAPVLYSFDGTTFTGALTGTPNTSYLLQFFTSPVPGPAQQGQSFQVQQEVTTDASGNATFSVSLDHDPNEVATATATNETTGDTSEFSFGPPSREAVPTAAATQSAMVETAFTASLSISLADAYGETTPNIPVLFTAPASGAGGTFANGATSLTLLTDASGNVAPSFTANTTTGTYTVTATIAGLPPFQFTLTNEPGAVQSFVVTVPPNIDQGTPFNVTDQAVDAYGNTVSTYASTVNITSDDPAAVLPAAQSITGGGPLTLSNAVVVLTPGTHTITVTDAANPALTGSATITVNNVAPSNLALTPSATTLSQGNVLTLNGSFTDPGLADNHTVIINWEDGTPDTTLSLAPDVFSFQAQHVYVQGLPLGATSATFAIQTSVTDASAATSAATSVVVTEVPPVVTFANDSPSMSIGVPLQLTGSFTEPGLDTFSGTVNYGDGSGVQSLALNADKSFVLNHVYAQAGSYSVTVTINDGHAATSAAASVTVITAAPIVTLSNNLPIVAIGIPMQVPGSFVDPGLAGFVGTVNYGDGSGVQNLPLNADDTFVLNHVYNQDGTFPVTVTITDGHQGIGVAGLLANVVLVGVNVPGVSIGQVGPDGYGTAQTTGITATLFSANGATNKFILVSTVPIPVAAGLIAPTSAPVNSQFSASFDVRAINVDAEDSATVTFSYSGTNPKLEFVDEDGNLVVVQGSTDPSKGITYVINQANHTITVVFDSTSTPEITELHGTVFTIAVNVQSEQLTLFTFESTSALAMANAPNSGFVSDVVTGGGSANAAPSASSLLGAVSADDSSSIEAASKNDPLSDLPLPPPLPQQQQSAILSPSQPETVSPQDEKKKQLKPPEDELQPEETLLPGPGKPDMAATLSQPLQQQEANTLSEIEIEAPPLLDSDRPSDDAEKALDLVFAAAFFLSPYVVEEAPAPRWSYSSEAEA